MKGLELLGKAMDKNNFEYLERHDKDGEMVEAITQAVRSGVTEKEIHNFVLGKCSRPSYAKCLGSASNHVRLLQDGVKQ